MCVIDVIFCTSKVMESKNQDYFNKNLERILECAKSGRNILIHGCGGCGKSYTLRHVAKNLTLDGKKVYMTALTGVAALNLMGDKSVHNLNVTTLHRFAGVGTAQLDTPSLIARVKSKSSAMKNWMKCQILIIDEFSMLGGELFSKLDAIAKAIRKNDLPFGGIQLILSGDLLQMAPVKDSWIFTVPAWGELGIRPFVLEVPYRYEDNKFFEMLLRIRSGTYTEEDCKTIRGRVRANHKMQEILSSLAKEKAGEVIKPTMFFSKNVDVDAFNMRELDLLKGEEYEFICKDTFTHRKGNPVREEYIKMLDDSMPQKIVLKVGAQVMLKKNLDVDMGLVNGSRGVVSEIIKDEAVIVKFLSGIKIRVDLEKWDYEDRYAIATRVQIPFTLAWGCTIHKCVSGDTMLFTDKGIQYIGDLVQSDGWNNRSINLQTMEGMETTSKSFKGEIEPSIIIRTRMGYKLEGSHRHPVLVRNEMGENVWKLLPEIEIGDHIVLRKRFEFSQNYVETDYYPDSPCPIITEEVGYLLGLIIGDGSCRDTKDGAIEFTNLDEEMLAAFHTISETYLGVRVCEYRHPQKAAKKYFCRKTVRDFLFVSGLTYEKGPNKTTPWVILQSPESVVKAYLQGLYDTDGGVNNTTIHFTSSSPKLASEVQFMLLSMGIISRNVEMPNNKAGAWRIELTGADARLFRDKIGFRQEIKQEKALAKFDTNQTIPKSNMGFFPDSVNMAQQFKDNFHLNRDMNRLTTTAKNGRNRLTFRHLEYISRNIDDLESNQFGRNISDMVKLGVFCDTVKSIENSKCMMYDLEVPGSHSFVSNGIISHNSQGCTLDYAVLDLGPSIFCSGQAYVALSRCKNINGLFISEFTSKSIIVSKEALKYTFQINEMCRQEDLWEDEK